MRQRTHAAADAAARRGRSKRLSMPCRLAVDSGCVRRDRRCPVSLQQRDELNIDTELAGAPAKHAREGLRRSRRLQPRRHPRPEDDALAPRDIGLVPDPAIEIPERPAALNASEAAHPDHLLWQAGHRPCFTGSPRGGHDHPASNDGRPRPRDDLRRPTAPNRRRHRRPRSHRLGHARARCSRPRPPGETDIGT